jgi:hypothetical protein
VSNRVKELERRRLRLLEEAAEQRRRLQQDSAVAGHWIRVARLIVLGARRATRLYRYWNHSTHP